MRLDPWFDSFYVLTALWGGPIGPHVCPASPHVRSLAAYATASPPRPRASAEVVAFVDVNVVPMDRERVLADQTVLVEGGRITALGPSSKVKVPAGAVRVDGRGQYLIPGLADMHAHIAQVRDSLESERLLLAYVASGVTTVRNLDYDNPRVGPAALALRARAAAGELLSPRIYTSGMWGQSKNVIAGNSRDDRSTTKPEDVAAQVAEYKAAGYDHLKSREDIDPTTEQGRALFDSLIAAAKRLDLPVVGHVPIAASEVPGWFERNPTALKSIEHLTAYPQPRLDWDSAAYAGFYAKLPALVALTKQAKVWNTPTALGRFVTYSGDSLTPIGRSFSQALAAYRQLLMALQKAGAGILLGTDNAVYGPPDQVIPREVKALVAGGLTPYQALVAGTRNVAEYYGTLHESGTVAVGKRADLVLLRGNPLADVGNVASPAGVMLGGRWLPRAELDRRLAAADTPPSATP